jgi:predicted HD superfamily hydrolase involved in NAD metabolism
MRDYTEVIRSFLDERRFSHSVSTAAEAVKLAMRYGADEDKAHEAGMLHDIAKCLSPGEAIAAAERYGVAVDDYCRVNTELLHGAVGAAIAKQVIGITDGDVLTAIACHTTGKRGMSLLDKIIYIADLIEPSRDFDGIEEIRETAYEDLDEAVIQASKSVINYVLKRELVLHPDTIDAYNDSILKRRNAIGK